MRVYSCMLFRVAFFLVSGYFLLLWLPSRSFMLSLSLRSLYNFSLITQSIPKSGSHQAKRTSPWRTLYPPSFNISSSLCCQYWTWGLAMTVSVYGMMLRVLEGGKKRFCVKESLYMGNVWMAWVGLFTFRIQLYTRQTLCYGVLILLIIRDWLTFNLFFRCYKWNLSTVLIIDIITNNNIRLYLMFGVWFCPHRQNHESP